MPLLQSLRVFPLKPTRHLFLNAVRIFFDDGVGEDLAGDALDLVAGGFRGEPVGERKGEVFALADGGYVRVADFAQGILDGLALGVQDLCLERDIDMCLHHP